VISSDCSVMEGMMWDLLISEVGDGVVEAGVKNHAHVAFDTG
jgi:hypothetical protein